MDPAVVVPLGMVGLYALFLWLGWRRPRHRHERVSAGVYRDEWKRFRNLNRLSIGILLLNPLSWFVIDFEKVEKSSVVVLLVIWAISLFVVSTYTTSLFRCPRCRNYYFGIGWWTRRNCVHCGLELYEGA